LSLGGSAAEGSYFTDPFAAGDPRPEVQDFVKKHVGRFGVAPDTHAGLECRCRQGKEADRGVSGL
jgi:branched-chain amino acid transport system substrate-binding protein